MNEKTESLDLEVHVDGEFYAGVCADPVNAWREAMHYANTVRFRETAKIEIVQVTRKVVYTQIRP